MINDNNNIEKLLSTKQLAVFNYFNLNIESSPLELSIKLNIARPTINQILNKLLNLKIIEKIGQGRSTRYKRIINNDLSKLLNNTLGIYQFSDNGEEEFYNYLKISNDINHLAFENNWPYILQATRNGRYKFYYQNSVVYFTLRYNNNNCENFVVIVNFLGKERKRAVLELCNFFKKNNIFVLIKNINKKELLFWQNNGFMESVKPWSKYSFRDDNSFPQYIISKETIKLRKINKSYKRLFNKFGRENIIIEPYNELNNIFAKQLLIDNANFLNIKKKDKKEEIIKGHLFFFDDYINRKIRLQHIKKNKLVGVSYLIMVNNIAFYNAIFCGKEKDLMKYFFYSGMLYIYNKFSNIDYISTQGSENSGQDFFKKRFHPTTQIEKTHIILK